MLTKDCLEEFKVECDLRRLSSRTTKSYYNSTALFLNYLDKNLQIRDLESIRPPHIKKYIQYLLEKKLSPSYINGILKCLRAFFKYAYGEGYIPVNPTLKVNWHREGRVLINTFTDDEVRSLLDAFLMEHEQLNRCEDPSTPSENLRFSSVAQDDRSLPCAFC